MNPEPTPDPAQTIWPSAPERAAMVKRMQAQSGQLTSDAIEAIGREHPWFNALDAQERSWITLVAQAGIDSFLTWFADDTDAGGRPSMLFNVAPQALARKISLNQTVDLVRTTIAVIEDHISQAPNCDRAALQQGILRYSREVAFAAARIYARAAEDRGAWDERMEALVVDAVVRGETDDVLTSRASALGWHANGPLTVVVGAAPPNAILDGLRRDATRAKLNVLASIQGNRLVLVLAGAGPSPAPHIADSPDATFPLAPVRRLAKWFGPGPIVIGPTVDNLSQAGVSARAALSGARSAIAWPEGPRVLSARDLLPERALAGNAHARRELVDTVYAPLADAGGDLLATCVSILDHGGSVEATGRALFIHPNTVRYRMKRIQDVTGYSPNNPREAYVLHLAITLGRLQAG